MTMMQQWLKLNKFSCRTRQKAGHSCKGNELVVVGMLLATSSLGFVMLEGVLDLNVARKNVLTYRWTGSTVGSVGRNASTMRYAAMENVLTHRLVGNIAVDATIGAAVEGCVSLACAIMLREEDFLSFFF